MNRIALPVIILMIIFTTHYVFGQLRVETELRPRAEYRTGYKMLNHKDSEPSLLVTQRSRLNLFYEHQNFDYGLSIQDVRVWGDEMQTSSTGVFGDKASLDLHQAWIEIKPGENSAIRIGRQAFSYDNERLLARRNWNQNALTYDALLYRYRFSRGEIDAAVSWNNLEEKQSGNNYPADRMKTLNFIYLKTSLPLNFDLSVLGLASGYTKGDSSETIYLRATYGINLNYSIPDTRARIAGYYQNGKNKTGNCVSAYLLSAEIKQNIQPFELGLGGVMISGQNTKNTSNGDRKTDHLFDIHYGARHKFYGTLDYFSNMPKGTGGGGLIDLFASVAFATGRQGSIKLEGHRFLLHSNVAHPNYADRILDRALGTEFDIALKQSFFSHFVFQGGYSLMLPEKSLEIIQGLESGTNRRSDWLWTMLTFKYPLLGNKQ